MSVSPGHRLGPYEILAQVGAGGMGEVYRAKDTRLDRTVAIKILPAHLSSNPDFKQRFEREARTISSLSHPYICALYDIGHQDGIDYLVMEFLEGETIAQRLNRRPLSIEQVLRNGMQIADALDKAHRQGIIHRDLKPGNIMITKSGVKLLDFGLAKLQAPVGPQFLSSISALPTEQRDLTAEGTIIGTIQYMSPEQLEGRETDARTDIFAMGTVLYEMATGRKAFTGKSQASLISAILKDEPASISMLQPMSPPAFDRVVKTCLAKDPDDRWQTAHDVMLELKWLAEAGSQAGLPLPAVSRRKNRERFAWAAASIFFLAMLLFAFAYFRNRSQGVRTMRLMVSAPANTTFIGSMALSPDASKMAFTTIDRGGTRSLWVRYLNSVTPQVLSAADGAEFPFWSPDGRTLGYFADGKLKKIELAGGPPTVLADASGDPRGGTWNRFGDILFSPNFQGPIYRVSVAGDKRTQATILNTERKEQSHRWPYFLPDGRHFLYFSFGGGRLASILIGSIDSKQTKLIVNAGSMTAYAPPGYLLFTREWTLMAQAFDKNKLETKGEPFPVADRLAADLNIGGLRAFSASENGVLAYRSDEKPLSQLVLVDRSGRLVQSLGSPANYLNPKISPDGSRLIADLQDLETTNGDLWMFQLSRGVSTRFTFDPADDSNPVWSPDSKRIVFSSDRAGVSNLYWKRTDGTGGEELLLKSKLFNSPLEWSQDGRFILYESLDPVNKFDLWILPLFGDRKPFAFLATPFGEWSGQFSPDARWIAYASNEGGRNEVYVRPFPGPGEKLQISVGGGNSPRWRRDGKELFYLNSDTKMMVVQIKIGTSIEVSTPTALFDSQIKGSAETQYDVSPDGQRFLINRRSSPPTSTPITIVINWNAEVRP